MMRRHLATRMPALSHVFGLHPWDIPRLTYSELDFYLEYLQELTSEG